MERIISAQYNTIREKSSQFTLPLNGLSVLIKQCRRLSFLSTDIFRAAVSLCNAACQIIVTDFDNFLERWQSHLHTSWCSPEERKENPLSKLLSVKADALCFKSMLLKMGRKKTIEITAIFTSITRKVLEWTVMHHVCDA